VEEGVILKAAIFDLGNTLIHTERTEPFRQRLVELGVEKNGCEIQDAFDFSDQHFMRNYPGELGQDPKDFYMKYLDLMLAYLHVLEISKQELYQNIFKKSPPRSVWVTYDETIPFLTELRRRGVQVGLLTNWDLGARTLLSKLDLIRFFDSIVVSSEIQSEKPAQKGFIQSLNELKVPASEAIYVGDNYYDDVIGANNVGMQAALLSRSSFKAEHKAGNYVDIHSLMELLEYFPEKHC